LRITAGHGSHTFALDRGGLAWLWGEGTSGQLGNGMATSLEPVRVSVPSAWLAAIGSTHTLVIDASGHVWSTGQNVYGELGNGTNTSASSAFGAVSIGVLADNTWLAADPDGDHLTTWREYLLGTDPLNADTNGDGIPDDVQADSGTPGAQPDADGDGVPNWIEQQRGTDPFQVDTDGDGVGDGVDAFPLDPTRWLPLTPTPGDTTPPVITLTEPTTARPVP
jgi:hypothetical protein